MTAKKYAHVLIGCGVYSSASLRPTSARARRWAQSLFGPALSVESSKPNEPRPAGQTSRLIPLDLPVQFVLYDITKPGTRAGTASNESGKIIQSNHRRLRGWLLQGIDLQFGKRAVRIGERGEKVAVRLEGGTSEFGDILLGAEGRRSVVRTYTLQGKDAVKPLTLGSLAGEVEFGGDEFAHQLSLAHSAYIIMKSTLRAETQSGVFEALDRVSDDGKIGYYYSLL